MQKKTERVEVLLPLSFTGGFDYLVPEGMELKPGDYVSVPFGRKFLYGVVWGAGVSTIDEQKLKAVHGVVAHIPPASYTFRKFIDWVSWYTISPKGAVLKMSMSAPDAFEPPAPVVLYSLSGIAPSRVTPSRSKVIALLEKESALTAKDIAALTGVSIAVIKELHTQGVLVSKEELPIATLVPLLPAPAASHLSQEQQSAAQTLEKTLGHGHSVTVLDGVTGSGKTEVYFHAIETALQQGRQVLVLIPEIALGTAWLARFEKRFGFSPTVWHSDITQAKRRESWKQVANGAARVVVGARSALFLPYKNLALIVVDEEHEMSYKQMEGVMYHARDMAIARGHIEKIPVVLVSATPSLETVVNIRQKKYSEVQLKERHFSASLPDIHVIDMRQHKLDSGTWLSPPLREALIKTVADTHQALLFLNRRGYAPLVLCRACGHRYQCPHCSSWLVIHKKRPRMQCHHCGYTANVPNLCSACGESDSLIPYGPGVERLAEEVASFLPEARVGILTSDNAVKFADMQSLLTRMESRDIDILIGTQMVAKGHHFPHLALVGVVDGDLGLAGGDLRAAERTYQLLHQVSGRAGREATSGKVLLQSYMPDHPVMKALLAGDRDGFMQLESEYREEAGMPPFGRLASVIIEGGEEKEVAAYCRQLVARAPQHREVEVLGPAPAPLTLLRGQYRYRLLIKTPKLFNLQKYMSEWLDLLPAPRSLKRKVDIDPYSFL